LWLIGGGVISKRRDRKLSARLIEYELETADVTPIDHAATRRVLTGRTLDLLVARGALPRHGIEAEILARYLVWNK
jgi:hypothetical protein